MEFFSRTIGSDFCRVIPWGLIFGKWQFQRVVKHCLGSMRAESLHVSEHLARDPQNTAML